MDIRTAIALPTVAFAVLTLAGLGLTYAQDDQPRVNVRAIEPEQRTTAVVSWPTPHRLSVGYRGNNQTEVQKALAKALAKLKAAEDSDEKRDAEDELQEALSVEYDERMDDYDKHIESLEKQLEEMRDRLSRRRKAKKEVVELRLKQLVAEVDGLGWPGDSNKPRMGLTTGFSNLFERSNFQPPVESPFAKPSMFTEAGTLPYSKARVPRPPRAAVPVNDGR